MYISYAKVGKKNSVADTSVHKKEISSPYWISFEESVIAVAQLRHVICQSVFSCDLVQQVQRYAAGALKQKFIRLSSTNT